MVIGAFSNEDDWVVYNFTAMSEMGWARLHWNFDDEDSLFVCQSPDGYETMAEAIDDPFIPDASDFDNGCGGGAWIALVAEDDIP